MSELEVLKAALREIDFVVGNKMHLSPGECAQIRAILSGALSERPLPHAGEAATGGDRG